MTLKISPPEVLLRFGIEAQHPDNFLRYQLELNPPLFLSSVKAIRARLKNPPRTANEYLATLISMHLPQTVAYLQQYENFI